MEKKIVFVICNVLWHTVFSIYKLFSFKILSLNTTVMFRVVYLFTFKIMFVLFKWERSVRISCYVRLSPMVDARIKNNWGFLKKKRKKKKRSFNIQETAKNFFKKMPAFAMPFKNLFVTLRFSPYIFVTVPAICSYLHTCTIISYTSDLDFSGYVTI